MRAGDFLRAVVESVAVGVFVRRRTVGRAEIRLPPAVGNAVAAQIGVQQVHPQRAHVDGVEAILAVLVAFAPGPFAQHGPRHVAVVPVRRGRRDHAADEQVRKRLRPGRVERAPRQRRLPALRPPVGRLARRRRRHGARAVELRQLRGGHRHEFSPVGADVENALAEVVPAGSAQIEIRVGRAIAVRVAQDQGEVHRLREAHVVQVIQGERPAGLVPQVPGVVRQRVEPRKQDDDVVAAADVHAVPAEIEIVGIGVRPDAAEIAEAPRRIQLPQRRPRRRQIEIVADVVREFPGRIVRDDRRTGARDRRRRPIWIRRARDGERPAPLGVVVPEPRGREMRRDALGVGRHGQRAFPARAGDVRQRHRGRRRERAFGVRDPRRHRARARQRPHVGFVAQRGVRSGAGRFRRDGGALQQRPPVVVVVVVPGSGPVVEHERHALRGRGRNRELVFPSLALRVPRHGLVREGAGECVLPDMDAHRIRAGQRAFRRAVRDFRRLPAQGERRLHPHLAAVRDDRRIEDQSVAADAPHLQDVVGDMHRHVVVAGRRERLRGFADRGRVEPAAPAAGDEIAHAADRHHALVVVAVAADEEIGFVARQDRRPVGLVIVVARALPVGIRRPMARGDRPDRGRIVCRRLQLALQPLALRNRVDLGVQGNEPDVARREGIEAVAQRGLRQRKEALVEPARDVRARRGVVVAHRGHVDRPGQLVGTNPEKHLPGFEARIAERFFGHVAEADDERRIFRHDPAGNALRAGFVDAALQIPVEREMQRLIVRRRRPERARLDVAVGRRRFVAVARAGFQPAQRDRMQMGSAPVPFEMGVVGGGPVANRAAAGLRPIPGDRGGRGRVFRPTGPDGRTIGLAGCRHCPQQRHQSEPSRYIRFPAHACPFSGKITVLGAPPQAETFRLFSFPPRPC